MNQISRITYIQPKAWGNVHEVRDPNNGIAKNRSNRGLFGGTFVEMGDGKVRILRTSDIPMLIGEFRASEAINNIFHVRYNPDQIQPDAVSKVSRLLGKRTGYNPQLEISVAECLRSLPVVKTNKYSFDTRKADEDWLVDSYHGALNDLRRGISFDAVSRTTQIRFQTQEVVDPNNIRNYKLSNSRRTAAQETNPAFRDFFVYGVISALYQYHTRPEHVVGLNINLYDQDGAIRLFQVIFGLTDGDRVQRLIKLNIGNLGQ